MKSDQSKVLDQVTRLAKMMESSKRLEISIRSCYDRYKGICLENPLDPKLAELRVEAEVLINRSLDSLHGLCLLTREMSGK
jgi:hypothetical protein